MGGEHVDPQMKAAGLRYLPQVIPTSIYATLTIESLIQRIDEMFEIIIFEDDVAAEA